LTPLPAKLRERVLAATHQAMVTGYNGRGKSTPQQVRAAVQDKTILITGASHGIGRSASLRLAGAGARVVLLARSAEQLEEAAAEITAQGGTAAWATLDLADSGQIDKTVAAIIAEHGPVDFLVNNAGKSIRRSVHLTFNRFHDYQRTAATNYLGPVQLTLGVLQSMCARGSGHIVNVGTLALRMPAAPRWSAYYASKRAFEAWARSVAPEVRADGVSMTMVYMGMVHTRMSAPTPAYDRFPCMTPEQAARLIEDAIVFRAPSVQPWWAPTSAVLSEVLQRPIEALYARQFPHGEDTESAKASALTASAATDSASSRVILAPR
jgi:short-subunit dehydrogenase